MPTLSPEILARLQQADKYAYDPRPREFLRRVPKRAVLIVVDGVTREAFARAHTPTFDALAARGVVAQDARTIFPTITGPAHTSLLTGARMQAHGFVYPKVVAEDGRTLVDFEEGFIHAETVAEAWRFRGLVSVGIGSRFLRGADAMVTEGIFGHDVEYITKLAIQALREYDPDFLMVVYYAADTMGHWFGPDADEVIAAIEMIDEASARVMQEVNLDETTVVVAADHGQMKVEKDAGDRKVWERWGTIYQGRVAWSPRDLAQSPELAEILKHPAVDAVLTEPELELLGANHPRWGKSIVTLNDLYWFDDGRPFHSYHGAWSEIEQHIPLVLSGAGIRAGARLGTCEIIDVVPTLSLLLGGNMPRHADGRILWEVLDADRTPGVQAHTRLILERDELLGKFKASKKDFANQLIRGEEFETRQIELKQLAEQNQRAIREESRKLREGKVG